MQTNFVVKRHNVPHDGPIEVALNSLAQTHQILSVTCVSYEMLLGEGETPGAVVYASYDIVAHQIERQHAAI